MPVISKKNSPQNRVTRLTDEQRDMVEQHIKLAYHIASVNRHRWLSLDRDEMISECMYGLMKAARNYDESLGYKFSTFACSCMYRHTSSVNARNRESSKVRNQTSLFNKLHEMEFKFFDTVDDYETIEHNDSVNNMLSLIDESDRDVVVRHLLKGEFYHKIGNRKRRHSSSIRKQYGRAISKMRFRIKKKQALEVGK